MYDAIKSLDHTSKIAGDEITMATIRVKSSDRKYPTVQQPKERIRAWERSIKPLYSYVTMANSCAKRDH